MPDIVVILSNGAVGGEQTGFGNVHQTFASPSYRIAGIITESLSFAYNVCVEVRQGLEPVLVDQLMMQTVQAFRMTGSISGPLRKSMARRMLASFSYH